MYVMTDLDNPPVVVRVHEMKIALRGIDNKEYYVTDDLMIRPELLKLFEFHHISLGGVSYSVSKDEKGIIHITHKFGEGRRVVEK